MLALFLIAPSVGGPWPVPVLFAVLGGLLMLVGGLLLAWGTLALGRNLTPFPRPPAGGRLVTTGAYACVRHPLYGGITLLCFGFSLVSGNLLRLLLTLALVVFFEAKSRREEAWLLEAYPEYAAYQAKVRKFLPGVY